MSSAIFRVAVIYLIIMANSIIYTKAQISYGGKPYYNSSTELLEGVQEEKKLTYSPTSAQLKNIETQKYGQALTFAHQFNVNYTPQNSGVWETLNDGTKVWRILISSPGAYSINLIFDRYKVPKGAKLFIYNIDYTDVIGSFTEKNNKPSGVLATIPVAGDQIIVEYQEPAKAEFNGELLIGAVNHDFLGVHKLMPLKIGYFGDAGSCNEDISCYDSGNNLDIRRSVGKLIVNGGELCTATLINNTSLDGTPYIITGSHCYNKDKEGSTTVFFMNYETPYCSDNIEGTKLHTVSGGITRVRADSMDIALVELTETPPDYYRPYYAGWTLNESPSKPFTTIHHPQGDVKKISTSISTLVPVSFNINSGYPDYTPFISNFHWLVSEWATGTTEGGSSGSALFDTNNRIVGTLSGGEANCDRPKNDYFTRFYKAWDLNSQIDGQFKHWLDPTNTGAQSLDGYDPYINSPFTRLTNVEVNETKGISANPAGGYISGHNTAGSTQFAEHFDGIKSASIRGVYLMPGLSTWGSSQTIDLIVWEGLNIPENIVARKNEISLNDLKANKEIYIEFAIPVPVQGDFYVGYEINYSGSSVDTFAVYHSASEGKLNNTMLVNQNGSWQYASDLYDGVNKSLWIDILAEMVIYGDTQTIPENNTIMVLFPNPTNTDFIRIDTKELFLESYEIISMSGYTYQKGDIQLESPDIPIYIGDIPNGVYVMKLLVEGRYIHYKFTKQN